jgi:hypothetical protein
MHNLYQLHLLSVSFLLGDDVTYWSVDVVKNLWWTTDIIQPNLYINGRCERTSLELI